MEHNLKTLKELMDWLENDGKDEELYGLQTAMEGDNSAVVHIEADYELIEQHDEEGEDCTFGIERFTVWTEDRVYVSDPNMMTVYGAPRHPPVETQQKTTVAYDHEPADPMVIKETA